MEIIKGNEIFEDYKKQLPFDIGSQSIWEIFYREKLFEYACDGQ